MSEIVCIARVRPEAKRPEPKLPAFLKRLEAELAEMEDAKAKRINYRKAKSAIAWKNVGRYTAEHGLPIVVAFYIGFVVCLMMGGRL